MHDVFTRDGHTCVFCGRTPSDEDPFNSNRKIKLHVGHIIAHKRKGGYDFYRVENIKDIKSDKILDKDDFLTMCNVCNEGAKNNDIKILNPVEKINKFNQEDQQKIYDYLKNKFS